MSAPAKPTRPTRSKKKPYTKPQIVYKQRLEARASACTNYGPGTGKSSTGGPPPQGSCGASYLFS